MKFKVKHGHRANHHNLLNIRKPHSKPYSDIKADLLEYANEVISELNDITKIKPSQITLSDNIEDNPHIPFVPNVKSCMRVVLPPLIEEQFDELSIKVSSHVYLTGSAVIDLIKGTDYSNDLDFVISESEHDDLTEAGYHKKEENSYYKFTPCAIDVKIVPYIGTHPDSWMHRNVAGRDFSICKLICDRFGNIYDPTGHGLADLNSMTLSMRGNEAYKLQVNAARMIRAIKYAAREFDPDLALIQAMHDFKALATNQKGHLYSVTKKLLESSDMDFNEWFVKELDQYGLLTALFSLELDEHSLETTVNALWQKVDPETTYYPVDDSIAPTVEFARKLSLQDDKPRENKIYLEKDFPALNQETYCKKRAK